MNFKVHYEYDKNLVNELMERKDELKLSMYIPTDPYWRNKDKAEIYLKNACDTALDELKDRDVNVTKAKKLVNLVRSLKDEPLLWQNTKKGLGIFLTEDTADLFILDFDVPSKVYIGPYFNIKYLIEDLFNKFDFYVLCLSENFVGLYKGVDGDIRQIEDHDKFPHGVDSATRWRKDIDVSVQHHTTKKADSFNEGKSTFHGHGAANNIDEDFLQKYLEFVDNDLNELLEAYQVPLILAGTESVVLEFQEITNYPNVVSEYIQGNPEDKNDRQKLLKEAWEYVQVEFLDQTPPTNIDDVAPVDIVKNAFFGKVNTLYVSAYKDIWGVFNENNLNLDLNEKSSNENYDIQNLVVTYVIKNDGKVYKVNEDAFESSLNVTAVMRY